MDHAFAIRIFSALAHDGRLSVFRTLVSVFPEALRVAEITDATGIKGSTLSAHLSALSDAGLLQARRDGTSIFYSLSQTGVSGFVDFLLADCCQGRPELCAPKDTPPSNAKADPNAS